jgi:hypothetical protein
MCNRSVLSLLLLRPSAIGTNSAPRSTAARVRSAAPAVRTAGQTALTDHQLMP